MNDFIDLQYEYIDIFICGNDGVQVSYLFHDITMNELAKWNHRTRCCCFVKLVYCRQDFGVTAFACVKALNNTVH
jgi:hypothetical protein